MENANKPKVLIISRPVWQDGKGTSSTLTNIWDKYGADSLAHIYIETKTPKTHCCNVFFQISEVSLIKRLLKYKTKTGKVVYNNEADHSPDQIKAAEQEGKLMAYARKHRSYFHTYLRDLLWAFSGWKSKELEQFIVDFNPDVVWMDGSPLILMNRLAYHVAKIANKPCVIFLQDDAYTYKSCTNNTTSRLYRAMIRPYIKRMVDISSKVFVCSPKMKDEYDQIFGINSIFLSKGADFSELCFERHKLNTPLRMVYMGNVVYGRINTLIAIAKALRKVNENGIRIQLSIYTTNYISPEEKKQLLLTNDCHLMDPVPYNEVRKVISGSDIVVFVESLEGKNKNIARLSFSTKLSDYLTSGRCIFAIGPNDIAPMEYLRENNAAIISNSINEIEANLRLIVNNGDLVQQTALNGFNCAQKYHDIEKIHQSVEDELRNML